MPDTAADRVSAYLTAAHLRAENVQNCPPSAPDALWRSVHGRAARDVPRLLAAVETALELHAPVDRGRVMNCCRGCEEENGTFHEDCCHEWPCPTYLAISAILAGTGEAGA